MKVTPTMIADIQWLYKTLTSMPGNHSKPISAEVVGKSLEFAKGMMYQREQDLKEIMELKNKYAANISRLRAQLTMLEQEAGVIN